MADVRSIRTDYTRDSLTEAKAADDPWLQFESWLTDAVNADLPEPNAMTLATVSATGQPSARIVLLRGYGPDGICFYTNYQSRKADELPDGSAVALLFFWPELQRQIRIEGTVGKVSPEQSDAYFTSRPRASQLGAWASPQSEVIPDRESLRRSLDKVTARFAEGEVPRPPHWGGYRVVPTTFEFWQGGESRLHDRLRYRSESEIGGAWKRDRLAP